MTDNERGDLSIGQVAERANVAPSALRYYESIGLLSAPRRAGGQRRYDPSVFDRLAVVQLAREAGFTLKEIRTLFHGFSTGTGAGKRWRALAERKLPEVEQMIARAQAMRRILESLLDCGCLDLDECGRAARAVHAGEPAS